MPRQIVITFYSKPECPLCEEAGHLLEAIGHHLPFTLETVNILQNRAVYDLYWNRIPVLEFADGGTLEPPITRERLADAIRNQSDQTAGEHEPRTE